MDMIERVARALEAAFAREGRVFDAGQAHDLARAAIEAMREPAEAMQQAGYAVTVDDEVEVWQTMIDAALKP